MDQTEFERQVRVGALNTRLSSEEIMVAQGLGLMALTQVFQSSDPDTLNARAIAQSSGIVFDRPANCVKIKNIWDLHGNGAAVSAVSISGGVPTITAPDFTPVDGEVVGINGLSSLGIPDAYYRITTSDETRLKPDGITAAAGTWASGGIVWRESITQPTLIEIIDVNSATGRQPEKWYPLRKQIVIDDHSFTNDILIDFELQLTALSDLDVEHHMTLMAFVVNHLAQPPTDPKSPLIPIHKKNQDFYSGLWQSGVGVINTTTKIARPRQNRKPASDF